MTRVVRALRTFKFTLTLFPLCFAGGAYAQGIQQVVLIDFLKADHSIRRETTVRMLGKAPGGRLRFAVHRELITKASQEYSKTGVAFPPPIRVENVSIYPSSFSKVIGDDTPPGDIPKRVIVIDEQAFLCIEGQLVDDLLGPQANARVVDKVIPLPARPVTNARLGMSANVVQEREISAADVRPQHQKWLTSLAGGDRAFIGNEVDGVDDDGPAARAGVQVGDLIVDINGQRTMTERKPEIIADHLPVGRPVRCTIIRRVGERLEVVNVFITPVGP